MQEQIKYTKLTEHSVAASGIQGDAPERLEIPGKMKHAGKNYTVTEVADSAFSGRTTLQEVYFNNETLRIGNKAFAGCENLKKAVFGLDGPREIKNYAFAWCGLTHLMLGEKTEIIGDYAFVGCSKLLYVDCMAPVPPVISDKTFDAETLERGLLVVKGADMDAYSKADGWKLFKNMESRENEVERLKNTLLSPFDDDDDDDDDETQREEPEDIIITDTLAFRIINEKEVCVEQCNPAVIGTLEVPNTVEKNGKTYNVTCIDRGAFDACKELDAIVLPQNMEEIHYRALAGCTSIKNIHVDPRNEHLSDADGVLFDKYKNVIICYPHARTETSYRIPASVMGIAAGCFINSTNLEEVYLYDSLRYVGIEAFVGCTKLRTLSLPTNMADLGNSAFADCKSITSIYIQGTGVPNINDTFDKEVTDNATLFVPRENLPLFKEADGWKKFAKIRPLNNISSTDSPFIFCQNSEKCATLVHVANDYKGELALPHTISLGEERFTLDRIGDHSLEGCDGITEVAMPDTIRSIGYQAFNGCTGLKALPLSPALNSISTEAFRACVSLRSLLLPKTVEAMGDGITNGCEALETIDVDELNPDFMSADGVLYDRIGAILCYPAGKPDKEFTIKPHIHGIFTATFFDAHHLTNIEADPTSKHFASIDGVLVSKDHKTLLAYPRGRKEEQYSVANTIETIGNRAFAGCNLTRIDLPASLTAIEMGAFYACDNLKTIELPDGLSVIGDRAFLACDELKEVKIPASVQRIEMGAFSTCAKMESIVIPEKVTTLEDGVFMDCASLSNVTLPPDLENIGNYAFANCAQLSHLAIPASVTNIGGRAFKGAFTELGLLNSILDRREMTLVMQGTTPPVISPDTFDEYTLQKTTLMVPSNALKSYRNTLGWAQFKTIVGSDDIENEKPVEALTFSDDNFHYKLIGEKELEITSAANTFNTDYYLPETVTFNGCEYVITRIGEGAFEKTAVLRFDIDAPLEVIGRYAFANTMLQEIYLPNTLVEIGMGAFGGCRELNHMQLPASLKEIGLEAFTMCASLTSIAIPNQVQKINYQTFSDCELLKCVTLGEGVESIEEGAFGKCPELENIAFGTSLESISKKAFEGCYSLRNLILPDSCRIIDDGAFSGCEFLQKISLPAGITYIGNEVFKKCKLLSTIKVAPGGERYCSKDGVLYTADLTELIHCPANAGQYHSVSLPAQLKHLANGSFENSMFNSIELPNGVLTIGEHCFANSKIGEIRLPEKLKSIGAGAFHNCLKLETVNLPKRITSIPDDCFRSCKKLKSITFPPKMKLIGTCAFKGCQSMKSVVINGENCVLKQKCFESCKYLETAELYGIKSIEKDAFNNCPKIDDGKNLK